jgi:hypothetical protein
MKVINKPIDVIAVFYSNGNMKPLRFRVDNKAVPVGRIMKQYDERTAGNIRKCFVCINNEALVYEIKYEISTGRWVLFKI